MRTCLTLVVNLLIIQLFTSLPGVCLGQDTALVALTPDVSELNLAPYLTQLKEPDAATDWTAEQALTHPASEWQPVSGEVPSYGFAHEGYWFRLEIKPEWVEEIDGLISISYPALDHLEVYRLESDQQGVPAPLYVLGDLLPFYPRYANNRDFIIPLKFKKADKVTFLFRAKTDGTLQLPIKYYAKQTYYDGEQKTLVIEGFYFGILFIMAAYNFFVFVTLRDSSYAYYSAFVLSILLFQSSLHGFAFQFLWPEMPAINRFMIPLTVSCCVIFGSLFSMFFLKTREGFPRINSLFLIVTLLGGVSAVASFATPYSVSIKLAAMSSLLAAVFTIGVGSYCWFKGVTHARYYFWGWTMMLASVAILNLNKQGVLPATLFTEYAIQIGSAVEAILLSFALGDRINSERKAKLEMQNRALQQERDARMEQQRHHVAEMAAQQKVISAQAESKAKSQFLATMSHEIRTPMNGVIGMSELLKETPLMPQQRNYVDVIIQSGKALLTVINDILDFSKIEAGKMDLELIDFELEKLCFECASVFRLTAEKNGIEFFVSIAPDVPAAINADPSRIRQLLLNLLGNAFKFTSHGSVSVNVSLDAGPNKLKFEVIDTGIGISEEQKQKLFQAFGQADSSITRKFGGTGLGLVISKAICELMGGSIGAESELGKGSRFWFTLQYSPAPEKNLTSLSARALAGKSVLAVHSNPYYFSAIARQAEAWGVHVKEQLLTQASLNELSELRLDKTDLLLIDSGFPAVLAWASDVKHKVRTIALAASYSLNANSALESAGVEFRLKPLSCYDLKQMLLDVLTGETIVTPAEPAHLTQLPLRNKHILIAEDNEVNQMVINGILRKLNLPFTNVSDGVQSVLRYQENPKQFDLILMDCEMPELDGFSATQTIRQWEVENGLPPVPIIALTAHAVTEYKQRALDAGMNSHIAKPIQQKVLHALLQVYLGDDDAASFAPVQSPVG